MFNVIDSGKVVYMGETLMDVAGYWLSNKPNGIRFVTSGGSSLDYREIQKFWDHVDNLMAKAKKDAPVE
jgi:hypothetical protein